MQDSGHREMRNLFKNSQSVLALDWSLADALLKACHSLHFYFPRASLGSLAADRNQEIVSAAISRIKAEKSDQTMCPLIKSQGPSKVIVQITVMGKGASLLAFPTLEPHGLGSNSSCQS